MTHFLVTWAITALGLLIISQTPAGHRNQEHRHGAGGGAGVGHPERPILRPILGFFALPITILTLGLLRARAQLR